MIILDEMQIINLHKEIGSRLLERLSYIKCYPRSILDFGYTSEYLLKQLSISFNKAMLFGLNILYKTENIKTQNLFNFCFSDPESLPLEDSSIDLIVSNLSIDYTVININKCFKELYRILKSNGILLFAMELKSDVFINIGNMLLINGFYAPVVDQELITLNCNNQKLVSGKTQLKIVYGYALGTN